MHADISLLELVLQRLILKVKILLPFFSQVLLYPYTLKVPGDYYPVT